MEFIYKVNANTHEWSETKENLNDGAYSSEFKNTDPFIARQLAFNRAKSYEESFLEALRMDTDHFFNTKNEIYKEFTISVSFIHPNTLEEIQIDIFNPFDNDGFKDRYDFVTINLVIEGLEKELKILREHNLPLENKIKRVLVHYQKETKSIEIIPTEFINKDKIKIKDISEML